MSPLYNVSYALRATQLTSDHGPVCMCHCIFFGINPHVTLHHAICLYRVTWWQLRLTSKEDICVTLCQLPVEAAEQVSLRLPVQLEQRHHLHVGTSVLIRGGPLWLSKSTAVDSGISDTRSIQVVSFQLRVTYKLCQWFLESFDLDSLCCLTFGRKSTVWQEISSCLDLIPKTQSLKEDMGKYQLVTISVTFKANNTLKVSKVEHCASWSSWFSCLQLWHKAYSSGGSDRQLLLAKELKETKHWFC